MTGIINFCGLNLCTVNIPKSNKLDEKIEELKDTQDLTGRIYQDGINGYYYVFRKVNDILYMYEYTAKEKIPIQRWPVLESSTNLGNPEILRKISILELQCFTLKPLRVDPQRYLKLVRFSILTIQSILSGYDIFRPWFNLDNKIEKDKMTSSWNKFVFYNNNNESFEILVEQPIVVESFRIYDLTSEDFPLD